jgi:hypothetical protein
MWSRDCELCVPTKCFHAQTAKFIIKFIIATWCCRLKIHSYCNAIPLKLHFNFTSTIAHAHFHAFKSQMKSIWFISFDHNKKRIFCPENKSKIDLCNQIWVSSIFTSINVMWKVLREKLTIDKMWKLLIYTQLFTFHSHECTWAHEYWIMRIIVVITTNPFYSSYLQSTEWKK